MTYNIDIIFAISYVLSSQHGENYYVKKKPVLDTPYTGGKRNS